MLKFVGNQFFPLTRMARTVRRLSYQGSISRTERKFAKLFHNVKPNSCSSFQIRTLADVPSPSIANINREQLMEFMEQNRGLVIDVRTRDELAATGVLPNSVNIPLDELSTAFELGSDKFFSKYNVTKPNKEQSIVFSCAAGIRSLKACRYVSDLGYKNLYNYAEGWFGWESQNK